MIKTSTRKSHWIIWTVTLTLVLLCLLSACLLTIRFSITNGIAVARDSFSETYDRTKNSTYSQFYDSAYELSEAENHVSNDTLITLSSIKEAKDLEVLCVYDTLYDVLETKEKTTSWLKVAGSGTYTVNLNAAEFIVDNERAYVLVRVPKPELKSKDVKLDNEKMDKIYFKENGFSLASSGKDGFALGIEQHARAQQLLEDDFKSNDQYLNWAEESTIRTIQTLIKSLNRDVENLQVEVEFYSDRS